MANCHSCGAEITWCRTVAGKASPIVGEGETVMTDYTARELRLIRERDEALTRAESAEGVATGLLQQIDRLRAERDHALSVLDEALDRARVRALWGGEIATLRERGRRMP